MKQVRMKTTYAGPAGCAGPGQVLSVSDAEATLLVPGYAEEVKRLPAQETAMVEAPEVAVTRAGRGRKR